VEPIVSVVLAIDTATPAVTAGIVCRCGGSVEVLAQRVTIDARGHAERLTPNVLAALADAGLTFADLDAVVVGCGPGPFTGLRVGMASAAAYGHALNLPVHGICSLDAIGVQTVGDALVVTDAAVAGPPDQVALFNLPRLDAGYPAPAGLVRAVGDWGTAPAPLIPMYLRRPDAKSLAERRAVSR
jgi:tRNA threonylcarbamoyl adenosine modification protein YeaZ